MIKKNNLIRKDLYNYISKKKGYSFFFCKKLIDNLIQIISLEIKKGSVNLKNIGSLKVINKRERLGRNPITKEDHIIQARKAISFKISKNLLKNINRFDE